MKEHEIPAWLNEEYLRKLLSQKEPQAKLLNYDMKPAVLGGNNNCSRMWRIKLNYKVGGKDVKSTSIMVKAPVPDGVHKEFLDEERFVEKEFVFYNEVIQKIYQITDNINIFPKNYLSTVSETIALEDLKEDGYVMCDRLDKLDFDHCKILMKIIAEFHAMSVAVGKQDPALLNKFGVDHFFTRGNRSSGFYYLSKRSFVGFSKLIKTWKGFERFGYLSEDKADKFFDEVADTLKTSKNLKVLNHGDLWTNNILFKYNEARQVVNAKLVDFQTCRTGSPGIDLHFFTWTSIADDVRENRLEELYGIYLDVLNCKLEEFGCEERLTKEQLEEELEATRFYGFFVLCVMLPIFFGDPDHPVVLDEVFDANAVEGNDESISVPPSKFYIPMAPDILLRLEDAVFKKLGKP